MYGSHFYLLTAHVRPLRSLASESLPQVSGLLPTHVQRHREEAMEGGEEKEKLMNICIKLVRRWKVDENSY